MKSSLPIADMLPSEVYTIKDNGIRCFVPPCFSWNVFDVTGKLVAQVSDVVYSSAPEKGDPKLLKLCFEKNGLRVRGYTLPGPKSDGARQAIKFIVQSVEANNLLTN